MNQAKPAIPYLRLSSHALRLMGAFGVRVGVQVLMVPILARVISPEAVGEVAMATPLITFTSIVAEAGLVAGLVRRGMNDQIEATAFWFTAAVGLGSAILIAVLAWPLSWLTRQPGLALILLAQAPALLFAILTIAPGARLQRTGAFGAVATCELAATVIGAAATLATALMGWEAFSLVAQQVVLAGVRLVGYVALGRFKPARAFDYSLMRPLLAVSIPLLGSNVLGYLSRSLDNVLIGLGLGTRALGFYATAYQSGQITELALGAAVRTTVMPAMAQAHDAAAARDVYVKGLRTISLIGAPLVVFAGLKAHSLVLLILGAKWMPSAPLVSVLAPLGLLQSYFQLNVAALAGLGRTQQQLKLSILISVLGLAGIVIGFSGGAMGVALGYAAGTIVASGPYFVAVIRALRAPWTVMVSGLGRPWLSSGAAAAAVLARERVFPVSDAIADLALTIALGGAVYVVALMAIRVVRARSGH